MTSLLPVPASQAKPVALPRFLLQRRDFRGDVTYWRDDPSAPWGPKAQATPVTGLAYARLCAALLEVQTEDEVWPRRIKAGGGE